MPSGAGSGGGFGFSTVGRNTEGDDRAPMSAGVERIVRNERGSAAISAMAIHAADPRRLDGELPFAEPARRLLMVENLTLSWVAVPNAACSTPVVAEPTPTLAELSIRSEGGDSVAKDALFAALYSELHRLAEAQLFRSGGNLTLGATTLLHEAYLDISSRERLAFPDRGRFMAYASRAMRGLVIDYVRSRGARKRGGELTFTTLDDAAGPVADPVDVEQLGLALDELALLDPALAELVDLKFFCGFSFREIAALRHTSERTVQRDWAKARALLFQALSDEAL